MQQVTYASKSFVTTDAVSDALLRLVTAIDRRRHSEAVSIPAFTDEGRLVEARLTLDAGSELVSVPTDIAVDGLDDDATEQASARAVADIEQRIQQNTSSLTHPAEDLTDDDPVAFDYDDY